MLIAGLHPLNKVNVSECGVDVAQFSLSELIKLENSSNFSS